MQLLSVLSAPLELFRILKDEISKYQRDRRIRKRLFSGLSTEVETYSKLFDELATIGEIKLLPLLQSLGYKPPIPQMNPIVECVSEMQFKYSEIMQAFIRLAKSCKEVSLNTAFMVHLQETSDLIHDFVHMVARTYGRDVVVFDDNCYRFFKLYQNEIFKKIKAGDVEEVVKEAKFYIKIAKSLKPYFYRSSIKRKTLRRFNESLRELNKVSKRIRAQKTTIVNLRYYVPSKLLPLVVLIEETFPLK